MGRIPFAYIKYNGAMCFCNAYFILVSFTLCHLRHRDINILNFIPCAAADDAVRCQSEDTLEGADSILSRFAENAVRTTFGISG